MVQEVKSDHEELMERDKMVPGVDPEIMKPRKRNLRLSWEPTASFPSVHTAARGPAGLVSHLRDARRGPLLCHTAELSLYHCAAWPGAWLDLGQLRPLLNPQRGQQPIDRACA